VRWIRLRDRYGDSGLIGVTIVHYENNIAIIDSSLMSCRVINRAVGQAMLHDVTDKAIARRCKLLRGTYVATGRNSFVGRFCQEQGFGVTGDGSGFDLDLVGGSDLPEWPHFIKCES